MKELIAKTEHFLKACNIHKVGISILHSLVSWSKVYIIKPTIVRYVKLNSQAKEKLLP